MKYVDPPPIPSPGPGPSPRPASPALPRWLPWAFGGQAALMAALVAGGLWWMRPAPAPGPTPPAPAPVADIKAEARAWGFKDLPLTFADSFEAARKEVLGTKPMPQIKADHIERWKGTRDASFNVRFERAFDAIIPPGDDNPTPEERRKYAERMGEIIDAIRGGVK